MRSNKEDFFSDPNWPCPQSLVKVRPSRPDLSQKGSNNHQPHLKEPDLDHSINLYLTRDQYTIDPPSRYSQIKQEQLEESSPLPFFSSPYNKPQKVKIEQPSEPFLIKQEFCDRDLSCQEQPFLDGIFVEEESEEDKQMVKSEIYSRRNALRKGFQCIKPGIFRAPYQILDKKVKKFLVKQTEVITIAQVSKIYGVSINNLCRWKKSCSRKIGAGRKIMNQLLETRLITWIQAEMNNNNGRSLTKKLIQQRAREWSGDPQFKASKGWLQRFVNRNRYLQLHLRLRIPLKESQAQESSEESLIIDEEDNIDLGRLTPRLKQKSLAQESQPSPKVKLEMFDELKQQMSD